MRVLYGIASRRRPLKQYEAAEAPGWENSEGPHGISVVAPGQ